MILLMSLQSEIKSKNIIMESLPMVKEVMEEDQEYIQFQLKQTQQAVETLEVVPLDIPRDWKDQNNCILGHFVLSPPIGFNAEDEGFTEDWAIIEIVIHPKSIQATLLEMLLSLVLPFQLAP